MPTSHDSVRVATLPPPSRSSPSSLDVYICCAPEDMEFARSLEEALRLGRRRAVVKSVDGDAALIEAVASFIFVISPASVAAPQCHEQLAQAVAKKKRLIPVVRKEVSSQELPRPLASISPVRFRAEDETTLALKALLLALETHLTVDIFICYSRKDKPVVDRLYEAFEQVGKRTWVDLRNIPLLAEWRAEIDAGIEAAERFLFVLSPDSVVSPECKRELAHALQLRKQLVPVLYREVADAVIPSGLGEIQRIPLRGDSFEADFERLVAALDTDQEHVRTHTRLLVRALDWEKRRDPSLLLRGKQLEEAEAWFASAMARQVLQPTPLHAEYLVASRKDVTRRLVLQRFAIALGLAITLGLLLAAIYQGIQKEQQRHIAVSRQLAAQAQEEKPRRLDLALLLGMEALRAADTSEARISLLAALRHSPSLQTHLHGHKTKVNRIAFSRDGTWFASASEDGYIFRWDSRTLSRVDIGFAVAGDLVKDMAISPDGKLIASAEFDGTLRIWDAVKKEQACEPLKIDDAPLLGVAFNPNGKLLVTSNYSGLVHLWDLEHCSLLGELQHAASGPVYRLGFSPDGSLLASGHGDGSVLLWKVGTSLPVLLDTLVAGKKGVRDLAFSPDSKLLITGGFDGDVRLWRLEEHDIPAVSLMEREGRVLSVAFSPDGWRLAAGEADGTVHLWDLRSLLEHTWLAPRGSMSVTSIAFSPDGGTMVTGSADGMVALWQMEPRPLLGRELTGKLGHITSFAFSPDGLRLAAGSLNGDVVLGGLNSEEDSRAASRCAEFDEARSMAFHPHRNQLAVAGDKITIVLLEEGGCKTIKEYPASSANSPQHWLGVAFSPDGQQLMAVSYDGAAFVWSVDTQEERRLAIPEGYTFASYAFSRDGKKVALRGDKGALILAETTPGGSILEINTASSVNALEFSPDGRLLLSGDDDGAILLRDANTGVAVGTPLQSRGERVFSAAFSVDGRMAAVGFADGTLTLWDIASRQQVGTPFKGHEGFVTSLEFSPDGSKLVSGGDDGSVMLWDVQVDSWKARACHIANRNLTSEEWERYLPDEPFHKTCE